jgi:hypothetical protein
MWGHKHTEKGQHAFYGSQTRLLYGMAAICGKINIAAPVEIVSERQQKQDSDY